MNAAPPIVDPVAFLDALPPHIRARVNDTQWITTLLVKANGRGWTDAQLVRECSRDMAGVRNPGAIVTKRLEFCAGHDNPDRVVKRPQWCGQCDETTRKLLDENGLPSPARCPNCHPLATRKANADDVAAHSSGPGQ